MQRRQNHTAWTNGDQQTWAVASHRKRGKRQGKTQLLHAIQVATNNRFTALDTNKTPEPEPPADTLNHAMICKETSGAKAHAERMIEHTTEAHNSLAGKKTEAKPGPGHAKP